MNNNKKEYIASIDAAWSFKVFLNSSSSLSIWTFESSTAGKMQGVEWKGRKYNFTNYSDTSPFCCIAFKGEFEVFAIQGRQEND